jgi:hypothetical protein
MLPDQVLVNSDVVSFFESAHFLCLTCAPDVLRARFARRGGNAVATNRTDVWLDFNSTLVAAARELPTATVVDAGRPMDQVEHDVREWINAHLPTSTYTGGMPHTGSTA